MNNDKYLVVVSGPAGTGKDTVVARLTQLHPEVKLSVSATSRAPRGEEQEGVNYYYLTREEFEQRIADDAMLEYAEYCHNYYGTPKAEVDTRLASGETVVLVIEVVGAANVKRLYPDCTTIFLQPPSYIELEQRLRGRGTETEEAIQNRLNRAIEEMGYAADYDETVVNADIDTCAEEIFALIQKHQQADDAPIAPEH